MTGTVRCSPRCTMSRATPSAVRVAARPRQRRAAVAADHAAGEHAELRGGGPARTRRGATSADGQSLGWQQTDDHIQQAEQRVFDCIAAAEKKLHVAPQRVFLAGFDCGGTMALRLAMSHRNDSPACFRWAVAARGRSPLGNLVAARRLAIFLAAGRDSREYPAERSATISAAARAGMSITLRQYPCGHEMTPQMLGDMDRWIIEQITAPCASSVDAAERQVPELD